jgi:hypothetical protein
MASRGSAARAAPSIASCRSSARAAGTPPRLNEEAAVPLSGTARPGTPRYRSWAALMRRAFGLDVLACARCGGRLRLIAILEEPAVVAKILTHLDRSSAADPPGPAPPAQRGAGAPSTR